MTIPPVPNGITGSYSTGSICDPGLNLASMLPSIMTPRVRTIVSHAIDMPLVPSWITGASEGDFTFTSQALARRHIKNAIVVPTLTADIPANVCAGSVSGLPVVGNQAVCPFPQVDLALTKTVGGVFPIDLSGPWASQ